MNRTHSAIDVAKEVYEDKNKRENEISHCCFMSLYVPATIGLIKFFPSMSCCTMFTIFFCFTTCARATGNECAKCYIKNYA